MQKKKTIFLLFFLIIFIFLLYISIQNYNIYAKGLQYAHELENMDISSPFSIDKIVFFSSATAEADINANSSIKINNLKQFTDIAIFINNGTSEDYNMKNTLKKVTLSNITINSESNVGEPSLYYKNIQYFGKYINELPHKIDNNFEFIISSEDTIDFDTPTLYNNTANPITLCYEKTNIKNNYTLADDLPSISYDGSLLKRCGITLNSISCNIKFLITIENNLNEIYTCEVEFRIPLSTENTTIYDGNIVLTKETHLNFVKNLK